MYKRFLYFLLLLAISLLQPPPTFAPTTGAIYPTLGTTVSESPWSDNNWTTPTNIYSDNAATANITASTYDNGDQSYVLKATGFDFSLIPNGSTIDGVIMRSNAWYRSGQGSGAMDLCQLLDASRAKVGTNNCSTQVALTTTNTTIITKGSSTDLWGNSLTTAWIKDPDFGVALGIKATAANADVDIDYVTPEVYYTPPTTTLADGSNPSNSTVAPGSSITDLDSFTLTTSGGTDSVTTATVTLADGTYAGLSEVRVTSEDGTTTYFSAVNDPSSNTVNFSGGTAIPVTTSTTTFKIRLTPKSHTNMPAPDGSVYSVTGTLTAMTSTNSQLGSDGGSATITIDNDSPSNVTSASATAGLEVVDLAWANPIDSDYSQTLVMQRASSAVTDTPTEGATYSVNDAVGSSTVVCLTSSTSCSVTGLTGGTAYHYQIFALDSNGNYSATGATPTGSPATPTAIIISVTLTTDGTIAYGITPLGTSKDTTSAGLNDTQTFQNNGNVAEDFTIKTTNALGGTSWLLNATAGSDLFVHEFSLNSGSLWTPFTTANSYQSLLSNLAIDATQNLDFRLTAPTSSTDYLEKTITITIQATQH